jgi:hypothetical protein
MLPQPARAVGAGQQVYASPALGPLAESPFGIDPGPARPGFSGQAATAPTLPVDGSGHKV